MGHNNAPLGFRPIPCQVSEIGRLHKLFLQWASNSNAIWDLELPGASHGFGRGASHTVSTWSSQYLGQTLAISQTKFQEYSNYKTVTY